LNCSSLKLLIRGIPLTKPPTTQLMHSNTIIHLDLLLLVCVAPCCCCCLSQSSFQACHLLLQRSALARQPLLLQLPQPSLGALRMLELGLRLWLLRKRQRLCMWLRLRLRQLMLLPGKSGWQ